LTASEPDLARKSTVSSDDPVEDLKAKAGAVYRVEQDVDIYNPSYLSFKVPCNSDFEAELPACDTCATY